MKASILIVLSHISQRIDFTMDIYENFQSVLNHFLTTEESLEMCFFTLLSIFQSQKQVKRVSTQLVKNFSGYIQFADLLVKAANIRNISILWQRKVRKCLFNQIK